MPWTGKEPLHQEETGKVCAEGQLGQRLGGPREERAWGLSDLLAAWMSHNGAL